MKRERGPIFIAGDGYHDAWAQLSKFAGGCYVLGCRERPCRDADGERETFKHPSFGWVPSCQRHRPDLSR
jgi:hypothetical protein